MLSKIIDFKIGTLRLLVRPKQLPTASQDWANTPFSELHRLGYKEFYVNFESQGAWMNHGIWLTGSLADSPGVPIYCFPSHNALDTIIIYLPKHRAWSIYCVLGWCSPAVEFAGSCNSLQSKKTLFSWQVYSNNSSSSVRSIRQILDAPSSLVRSLQKKATKS